MGKASEVRAVIREAQRHGWTVHEGGRHPYLERNGVKVRYSKSPGSDAAVRAIRARIRKERQI